MTASDARLVADATARILADFADPQTVNAATTDDWKPPLWAALEDAGLTLAWVDEGKGGSGGSLMDGFEVARAAGQYAAPAPLVETMLAGWFLAAAGLEIPSGPIALGPVRADGIEADAAGRLSGRLRALPFASSAHLTVIADGRVSLLAAETVSTSPRPADLGGERGDVTIDAAPPLESAALPAGLPADALDLMGAAARAQQMTGALETLLHITASYAQERSAFGRPIAKFQAVQHNLARLAGEVAAALTAAGSAAEALQTEGFGEAARFEVAAAKVRVGEAASEGALIAHQVMGAIGFTAEHILQRFTRSLWGWRDDFGSEAHWAVRLGQMAATGGADALWPMITAR